MVRDLQSQINYLLSMVSNKIATEGGGGSQFYDPEGFFDATEEADFKQNRNNPRKNFRLKPGYLKQNPRGPAVPVMKTGAAAEINNLIMHLLDVVWPRVSGITPASQGRTESSAESGYLYRLKKLQSDITTFSIFEGLRIYENELGEAYLMQAAQTHGDGVERRFYHAPTKGSFVINERRIQDGMEVIVNDMSKLRELRHRVIVSESDDAPTRKVEIMAVASEAMKTMPQTMTLTLTKLASLLALSIDNWNDEEKETLKHYNELEIAAAEQQMRVMLAEGKMRELKAMMAIGQGMNPGGPPGPGAEGQPVEGAAPGGGAVTPEPGAPPPSVVTRAAQPQRIQPAVHTQQRMLPAGVTG
jgi:hypothetical protein